jgi:hypothetical protein
MFLGLRKLTFSADGHSVGAACTDVKLIPTDKGTGQVTFTTGTGDSYDWSLEGTYLQSTDTGSLDNLLWTKQGQTVNWTIAPAGGETASADNPVYSGTCVVSWNSGSTAVGGAASQTDSFTSDFKFAVVGTPTRTVA